MAINRRYLILRSITRKNSCGIMKCMNRHFLQSEEWEKYQELEGKKTFRVSGDGFDALAILNKTPMGNYLYLPYGPFLKSKESLSEALGALKKLAESESAYAIRIEPTMALDELKIAQAAKNIGASSKKSHDLDPRYTWVLDLDVSEEELLDGIEKTKVRNWRNRENKGISIRTTVDPEEISILTRFLAEIGEKDDFTPQSEEHLKNQLKAGFATLYVCEVSEEGKQVPIGASLVYDYDDTRFYAHAATDSEHRKLRAGNILLVQMILDAKASGKKIFDFWGITKSEDPNHPWYGFTQYKMSFGGREVDYSGTYDIILNSAKYKLYEMMRAANRKVRKLKH